MQAQKGRAGVLRDVFRNLPTTSLRIPLKEIFQKLIEYYLQKTQNVHNTPTP